MVDELDRRADEPARTGRTDAPQPVEPAVLAAAVKDTYRNSSLATVNDHEVRMSIMTGGFGWHEHPDSDEVFLVIDGELVIEFGREKILLKAGQMLTVPRGTLHRTRPAGSRSVNLTFERKDALTIFRDSA